MPSMFHSSLKLYYGKCVHQGVDSDDKWEKKLLSDLLPTNKNNF